MSVRVIVIDDSSIAQRRLEEILELAPDIRVVKKLGSLEDLSALRDLGCGDVVVLDMWMPGRSGLSALSELVEHARVVVVSDAEADSEVAREALARGAMAYASKRELGTDRGAERLRRLVREAAEGRSVVATAPLLVIAGSTGAHRALARLAPAIAGRKDLRTVIVQHLAEGSDDAFVQWLRSLGVDVALAAHGQWLSGGRCLVAPAGRRLSIEAPGRVRLLPRAGELHAPSADVVFESAAFAGPRLTAVVLSGLGNDGARGVVEAARRGARILVQSAGECVAPSMPSAALRAVAEARSLSIDAIASELARVA